MDDSLTLMRALGYDMCSLEFAVRDGIPYAIDFMNPAPDMDINSLTPHYFEWVVKDMADLAIRLAKEPRRSRDPRTASTSSAGARAAHDAWRPAVSMLRIGIERYHALLTDELAGETQRQLDDQLAARGLFFGDRALCTVLRPRFLSPAQYRFLQTARRRRAARLPQGAPRPRSPTTRVLEQFGLDGLGATSSCTSTPASATRARCRGSTPSSSPTRAGCASPSTTPRRRRAARTTTCSPRCSSACRSCAQFLRVLGRAPAPRAAQRAPRAARCLRAVVRAARPAARSRSWTGPTSRRRASSRSSATTSPARAYACDDHRSRAR